MKSAYFSIPYILFATPVMAHIGHVGEVAGHGHLIGMSVLVVAAIVALILKIDQRLHKHKFDEEQTGEEQTGEVAS